MSEQIPLEPGIIKGLTKELNTSRYLNGIS